MKFLVSLFISISLINVAQCTPQHGNVEPDERKMNFYVVMIPETTLQKYRRARQDDADDGDTAGGTGATGAAGEAGAAAAAAGVEPGSFTETGISVGQILSGVFNADIRSIFAGSASFIDEPDVRMGVGNILANVANPIYDFMMAWVNGARNVLGITTMKPPMRNRTRTRNTTTTTSATPNFPPAVGGGGGAAQLGPGVVIIPSPSETAAAVQVDDARSQSQPQAASSGQKVIITNLNEEYPKRVYRVTRTSTLSPSSVTSKPAVVVVTTAKQEDEDEDSSEFKI